MFTRNLVFAIFGATIIAGAALAHTPEKGKHGGKVVEAGDYHVEAVVKGTTLDVFVRDHDDKDISTKGFKGTAILIVNGKPAQIALTHRDGNVLTGTSPVALAAPIRGAIQITNAQNKTVQAKY
jgi:hypothetical protein